MAGFNSLVLRWSLSGGHRCRDEMAEGESDLGLGDYFGMELRVPAHSKPVQFLNFGPNFYRGIAVWCSWRCVREPDRPLITKGIVTVI